MTGDDLLAIGFVGAIVLFCLCAALRDWLRAEILGTDELELDGWLRKMRNASRDEGSE